MFKLLMDSAGQTGAFLAMISLSQNHMFDVFMRFDPAGMDYYYKLFERLLREKSSSTYFQFKHSMIHPSMYMPKWILSLFSFVSDQLILGLFKDPEL